MAGSNSNTARMYNIEQEIASYLTSADLASVSRVSKAYRAGMEHFLYEDICITTEHDKRLLKLFTAVMEKPTRARFVESYRFGREDLEEIAVDEEEEEVEEDTGEDDDDAEGKKATVHVQSARDNSPALEDNQALTYFVIRSPSPTPSIASIASDDTDHGSLLFKNPVQLTAANDHRVVAYTPLRTRRSQKDVPKPTILHSGFLPTSISTPDPQYPTLDMSKLWPRLKGAVKHAYPTLANSDVNRWQAFLRANTKEARLGLLLQLLPNLTSLSLDITGKPSAWPLTVIGTALGCQPARHRPLEPGLDAPGIHNWDKLTKLELRGPGFNMREVYQAGRVVCALRLPLYANLRRIRLFGVEVADVYFPPGVVVPRLLNLELVNVAISDTVLEKLVGMAKGLMRLRVERLKKPYRWVVEGWTLGAYEDCAMKLYEQNAYLGLEMPELKEAMGCDVEELVQNRRFEERLQQLRLEAETWSEPSDPGEEDGEEIDPFYG